ncbi:hypothetical protein MMC22_003532 [Lobaria immixta]|nr:hypothetical protein [Lobaria immixta]
MDTQRFHRWAAYFLFYCCAFSAKIFARCYLPNGTDVNALLPTEVYQPCDAGDEDSMCCALNRPSPDECRSDGQYLEGNDIQLANTHATITPCGDGSYCCGNGTGAQPCCDEKKGVFLSNGETTSSNPSGTSSLASKSSTSTSEFSTSTTSSGATTSSLELPVTASLASSPTTSPALSRTLTSNTPNPNSSKNNVGAIVGGVLGGIAILVLIVGMILILVQRNQNAGNKSRIPQSSGGKLWSSSRANTPDLHEVFGTDARIELDARHIQELDAGRAFHGLH